MLAGARLIQGTTVASQSPAGQLLISGLNDDVSILGQIAIFTCVPGVVPT